MKIGKRVLTILLLVTMLLALIPINVNAAISEPILDAYAGVYDDEVEVEGDGVTAGATVNVYWDSVKSWDGAKGLLGSTTAKSDGSYEFEFDVPEAENGNHYVWVKDGDTGDTERSDAYVVGTDAKSTPDSGLEDDDIEIEGWGFGGSIDVAIGLFDDFATAPATFVDDEDTGDTGDDDEDEFDFITDNKPLVRGSVVVTDGVETFTDDGDGDLTGDMGGDGSVNYVTGEISVEFEDPPAMGADIEVDYSHFENVDNVVKILTTSGMTNSVGSFDKMVTVPETDDMIAGTYELIIWDGDGNEFEDEFTIGAVITLDMVEGPVGSYVEIEGRGFTPGSTIDQGEITIDGTVCYIDDDDPIDVEADGDFDLEIIIPQMGDEDDYVITVADVGGETATADFEVTELAKVTVTPEHGLQGEKVTVEGWYFSAKSGEDVEVTLGGLGEDTFETDKNGHFEGTFTIPGLSTGTHTLLAIQDDYMIDDTTNFRAGLVIVVATPDSVKVGQMVTFTGTGFTPGEQWNGTFGDEEITDGETVEGDGTFTYEYYVPTMDTGTYVVTFGDIDAEITVTTEVDVTETTMVEVEPVMAPNEYDIIIRGWNFKYMDGINPEFELYNSTDDWDITDDVYYYDDEDNIYTNDDVETDDDEGNFTAWYRIYDDEELSLGTYTIMVTVDDDWVGEVTFDIIVETLTLEPRKASFQVGDTVGFDVWVSFTEEDSYIEIEDPSGNLYWKTDDFDEWLKVGTVYTIPYYQQTAGANPMILPMDAPLGTWTWTWLDDDGDEIDSGAFNVVEAAEAVLEEKINELGQDIADLQDDISGVKSEASSAKDAANAAKSAADAATDAVESIGMTASDAKDAADAAKDAANEAKDAATGIQTLVYVAIGGSVIAALAAIVALMQISRRIAG
jgi:hypothetical protein